MEKRLLNYLAFLENELNRLETKWIERKQDTHGSDEDKVKAMNDSRSLMEDLLLQIGFFSHERLVHLIVTVVFALLTMMAVATFLMTEKVVVIALVVLFMVLLVPYIRHYYILENGVQKLYTYYDRLRKLRDDNTVVNLKDGSDR